MYTKGLLERFGETISDAEIKEIYQARIDEIIFEKDGDFDICVGRQLTDALRGCAPEVQALEQDLNQRLNELVTEKERQHFSVPTEPGEDEIVIDVDLNGGTIAGANPLSEFVVDILTKDGHRKQN